MRSSLASLLVFAIVLDARAEDPAVDAVPTTSAPAVDAAPAPSAPAVEAAPAPAPPPDLAQRARSADLVQSNQPKPLTVEEYLRNEAPTSGARIELAVVQGLLGLTSGAGTMQAFGLSTPVRVAGAVVGSGGGIATSLLLTRDGITPGHALAINSGAAWGVVGGLALATRIGREQDATRALAVVGHLSGAALGHLAWSKLSLAAGNVALANSGALWTMSILQNVTRAAGARLDVSQPVVTLGAFAGLAGGYLASLRFPISRTRVFWLDAGAIAGGLSGLFVDRIASGSRPGAYFGAAVGTAAGLAVAAYLTRNRDLQPLPVSLGLTPTDGGAVVTLALQP